MKYLRSNIESFYKLQDLLKFNYPINFTGGWAASPDFLLIAVREILKLARKKNKLTILEAGSGVSTVVLGYLVKNFLHKNTLVVSLEHSYDFFQETQEELNIHGLQNYVKLLYTPLRNYWIDDKEWVWYDTDKIKNILRKKKIDVLLIDGPPESIQQTSRYPVVPLLKDYLSNDFILLLDDAKREGEKEAVNKWKRILETFDYKFFDTEKGTAFLRNVTLPESKKAFFSVCIPTFNRASYLKEAIESVLMQNYSNFEIIIYDDGSTDNTEDVVKSFRDKRIKYIKSNNNRGRPFARNECIKAASGEWIVWLDDDDKFQPDLLSFYAVNIYRFPEVSIFYCDLIFFKEGKLNYFSETYDFFGHRDYLKRVLFKKTPIANPGVCIKKEIFNTYGLYNEKFPRAQDYEFWSRVLPFIDIKKVNYYGIIYRLHESNISGDMSLADFSYESVIKRSMLERVSINDVYGFSSANPLELFAEDLINHYDYFNAAYYIWIEGKKSKVKEIFKNVGFYSCDKQKKFLKKILRFIDRGNYEAALSTAKKAGYFYLHLLQGYSLIDKNNKKALAAFKRAALLNPIFDFNSLGLPDIWIKELLDVQGRVLSKVNSFENRKGEFISYLKEEL